MKSALPWSSFLKFFFSTCEDTFSFPFCSSLALKSPSFYIFRGRTDQLSQLSLLFLVLSTVRIRLFVYSGVKLVCYWQIFDCIIARNLANCHNGAKLFTKMFQLDCAHIFITKNMNYIISSLNKGVWICTDINYSVFWSWSPQSLSHPIKWCFLE